MLPTLEDYISRMLMRMRVITWFGVFTFLSRSLVPLLGTFHLKACKSFLCRSLNGNVR